MKLKKTYFKKLDKITGILAIQEIDNLDDKIRVLKTLGFSSDEIGPFVNMKSRTVRDRKGWKQK